MQTTGVQAQVAQDSAQPAALFTFCDIPAEDELEFNEWYNREHMRDRVLALPGFKRGRRFMALDASPKYLAFYEANDASVFRSKAYVDLISQPDPSSRHFILRFRNPIRTIARMSATLGEGEGSVILVQLLAPRDGAADALRRVLIDDMMPRVHAERGIIAVRLIERDPEVLAVSGTRHVRQGDRTLDWAVIIEAGDTPELSRVAQTYLDPATIERHGGQATSAPMLLRLIYRVSP